MKHLQPADVSWNKPFKEEYYSLDDQGIANGRKSYTPAGNVHLPSKLTILQYRSFSKTSAKYILCFEFS